VAHQDIDIVALDPGSAFALPGLLSAREASTTRPSAATDRRSPVGGGRST